MCYNPITIINPCKYVSLRYRERYLLQVPCGHCAECATNKSNEWYFRSYHQTLDCLTSNPNSFVLFDTLTYRDADLPHISDFVPVPNNCDYPCFSTRHIQLFNKRLRKRLQKYNCHYSFFLTSEYGTSEKHTHRPHYHILIYCADGNIDPLQMSLLISQCWSYGRTDGIPYKNKWYVRNNIFTAGKFAESLRTCRYVSKYVQKSCKFEREIQNRLDKIMLSIADKMKMVDDWINSPHARRVRMKFARLIGQFHRQSKDYGASFMRNIDITNFSEVDNVFIPDSNKVHLKMPLPLYYKRKFYYEVVNIDGNDTWVPTKLGMQYLRHREKIQFENLVNRYTAANNQAKTQYDAKKLADYVLNVRGRICAVEIIDNPLDKFKTATLYSYSTLSDKEHLQNLGVTPKFAGNNTIGYRTSFLYKRMKFKMFVDKYVMLDDTLEKQLDIISSTYQSICQARQRAHELTQELTNKYKQFGII